MSGVDGITSSAFSTGFQQLLGAQSRRAAEQARARAETLEAQAAQERRRADLATDRSQALDDQAKSVREQADRLGTTLDYSEGFGQAIEQAKQTVSRLATSYGADGQATTDEPTGTALSVVA